MNRAARRCGLSAALAASFLVSHDVALAGGGARVTPPPKGMASVGPAVYRPLYPASPAERTVNVARFWLDVRPVTNRDFLTFVVTHPEWRRDRIKAVFADEGYLSQWGGPDALGSARAAQPVTQVSWFAAKAYCIARGARLPTERQWEVAALASETAADGSADPAWRERILAWYGEPVERSILNDVGKGKPNYLGIQDLHGLVWEWVYDFGASLVSADSREKGEADKNRFCGGSAADARDPSDYAAFMRIAFRSALEARYATARLGFRCAQDPDRAP
jgi:formylglycine-generating enzyme required for sulfatase activity